MTTTVDSDELLSCSISPMLSLPFVCTAVVYFLSMWNAEAPFALTSNAVFLAVGYQRLMISHFQEHTPSLEYGLLSSSCFIYILLGASSLSFHSSAELSSASHAFDILSGFLLISHIVYVLLVMNIHLLLRMRGVYARFKSLLLLTTSLLYLAATTTIVANYERIYSKQMEFYVICASISSVLYAPIRLSLSSSWTSRLDSFSESLVLLLGLCGAVVSQSQMAGTRYANGDVHYEFYHGSWHVLVATTTGIIYTRCGQLTYKWSRNAVRIQCRTTASDSIGLLLLSIYSLLAMLMKELRVSLDVAKVFIGLVVTVMACHGGYNVIKYVTGQKIMN